ncbi:MAG TPA: tetratricopeptide repeat protein, partial [Xanthobacteraceae bacterium]
MACVRTIPNFGRLSAWRSLVAVLGFLGWIVATGPARSAPLPASVSTTVSGGYARLVFSAGEYIDATTRVTGNVLIITFKRPVNVTVDRIPVQAADYIGAARRDPDGMAVRMALAQKVTVHAIAAGEKFFIDLLPDSWKGVPPGLPQDVIDDLARRAREAEKILQRDRHTAEHTKLVPIRVHVATQPTFTRYIFDITDQTSVSAERSKDRLVLNFDAPLSFDLAEAQAALPSTVEGLTSELEADTSLIRFAFGSKVDVRTFRDEKGYVVDVVDPSDGDKARQAGQSLLQSALPPAAQPQGPAPQAAPPEAVPATKPAVEGVAAPPAAAAVAAPAKVETPKSADAAPTQPAAADVASPAAAPVTMQQSTTPPASANDNKQGAANTVEKPVAAAIAATPVTPSTPSPPPAGKASASADVAAPPSTPMPDAAKRSGTQNGDKVSVELARDGGGLKLTFPFGAPTGAAVFHRADALWLVFDANADVDLSALDGEPSRTIRGYNFTHASNADVVKLKLDRPHLSSVSGDGSVWTLEIGDSVLEPTRALDITRNVIGSNRSSVSVTLDKPQHVHRIADSEVGDALFVVTALPPARGFINEQDFIEFRALASTQGVVIEPLADDINVELAADKVVVSRPNGLTLSASMQTLLRAGGLRPVMFDSQVWGLDREATYIDRQSHLLAAAAAAPENKRLAPRLDLARFYLARDMYPEAKGVLDVTLADDRSAAEGVSAAVLRSIAEVMMNRPEDALKDLGNPAVGDQHDAPLWRALAYAHEGKWAQAREGFRSLEAALATLPVELQRVALKDEMRSAIEVGDYDSASNTLND